MNFTPWGGIGLGSVTHVLTTVIAGLWFVVMFVIAVGLIFLLVRFLLVATRAAQIYVAKHAPVEPTATAAPDTPATPTAPAAPADAATSSVVPPTTSTTSTSAVTKPLARPATKPAAKPRTPKTPPTV